MVNFELIFSLSLKITFQYCHSNFSDYIHCCFIYQNDLNKFLFCHNLLVFCRARRIPYIFGPHTHTHRIIYGGKLATRFYFLSNCERLIWNFHCRLSHKWTWHSIVVLIRVNIKMGLSVRTRMSRNWNITTTTTI